MGKNIQADERENVKLNFDFFWFISIAFYIIINESKRL